MKLEIQIISSFLVVKCHYFSDKDIAKKGDKMQETRRYAPRTDYTIHWEKVKPGTYVSNFLEKAEYTTSEEKCIVITGTVGEQWPIDEKRLAQKYGVKGDLKVGDSGNASPIDSGGLIHAYFAEEPTEVRTSWGTALQAKVGDAIVFADKNGKPDEEDSWVVDSNVFRNTYKEVR